MGFFTKDVEPSVLELHDLDALVNDGGVAKPIPLSKAPPFTVVPMAASEELEIIVQLCVWCFAALSPLVALAWLVWSRCSLLAVLFALAVVAASTYPHPIRVCDPTRLSNPIRNMKAAAAFIRYFSFRMVVEDLDSLTKLEGAKLFAATRGVPPRVDGALDLGRAPFVNLGDALGAFRFAQLCDTFTYARQLLPVRLVRPHEQLDAPRPFRLG